MFTYDATARAGVRQDYAGGVEDNMFFLRNGGFFNDNTEFKSVFTSAERNCSGCRRNDIAPEIEAFICQEKNIGLLKSK